MWGREKKATSAITLLLVGTFIAACGSEERHRAFYSSKEACLKDWGTESSCQQSQTPNGGSVYFGPWYGNSSPFWGRGGGSSAGIVTQGGDSVAASTESAHFGGFGESASAHGGVGE
jgi:hypothetical protein